MDWDTAAAFTERAVAAVFDTVACQMVPMTLPHGGRDGNARPVADGAREGFGFLATLDLEPSQDSIPRHLTADPGVNGMQVAYDAVVTALVTGWPWLPRRGDRIGVGAVLYEIKLERVDGSPRRAFYVNRVN